MTAVRAVGCTTTELLACSAGYLAGVPGHGSEAHLRLAEHTLHTLHRLPFEHLYGEALMFPGLPRPRINSSR